MVRLLCVLWDGPGQQNAQGPSAAAQWRQQWRQQCQNCLSQTPRRFAIIIDGVILNSQTNERLAMRASMVEQRSAVNELRELLIALP